MPDNAYNILFLCTRNAARSVMAEAIVNRDGHGRFHAVSAGTAPAAEVRPEVMRYLRKMNYNPGPAYTKSLKELIRAQMPEPDFLFAFCDQSVEKTCPVWPGHPMTALWTVRDPGGEGESALQREAACAGAFRAISDSLHTFMNLPKDRLDSLCQRHGDRATLPVH